MVNFYETEAFKVYGFYSALLALKMFAVVFLTVYYRMLKKVFANPEDAKTRPGAKVGVDQDVERIRRVHLNDMENIIPFWIVGFLYTATHPSLSVATLCFRVFGISRIIHTIVYVYAIPQPSRALSFMVGLVINIFMAFNVLMTFA